MEKLTQKTVESKVDAAITSDNKNAEIVKQALALSIMFAASEESGRIQPLNRLVAGVTMGTREAIRQFIVNMTRAHGVKVTNDEGKDKLVTFLNYSAKNKAYSHAKNLAVYKEAREKIAKLSEADLMKLVLGSPERDATNRVEEEFTLEKFEERIAATLKRALSAGAITTATVAQFNKLISDAKRVDATAVEREVQKKLEAAQATVKRLAGQSERLHGAAKPNGAEKETAPAVH